MSLNSDLYQRALKIAPGGVHSPVRSFRSVGGEPIFFKSAQGCRLTDVSGKTYLDFCQSFGPLILGHRDPEVMEEVHRMVETAWSFGACEPYSLELAEFILQQIPWLEKIRFVNSGTEAVMSALRLARAYTQRSKILKFDGCYHGHWDGLLVKAGSGLAGESSQDSAGIPGSWSAETLVAPLDNENVLNEIFAKHGKEIAAVIIEPLPANYGLLPQKTEFLKKIAELSKKHGSLLIFDEVISGFRAGMQGMAGLTGIRPDLVTYGKIIGGGFPVGAFAGRKDIMDLLAPLGQVYQAGTLSGNPIGMRAGLITLKKIAREQTHQTLRQRNEKFCGQLKPLLAEKGFQVNFVESLFWIHVKNSAVGENPLRDLAQIPSSQKTSFAKLFHALLKQGIYLPPSGFEVGFLSNAHQSSDLDETLAAFKKALQVMDDE